MITIGEAAIAKDLNWNIVVQYTVGICVLLVALFALWDRVKKCFVSKEEWQIALARINVLETENHEHRVNIATLQKHDGKLDQILELVKKRRSND